ncbi:MAG: DUF456 domain-containing protein [Anaerolineae bacterium]
MLYALFGLSEPASGILAAVLMLIAMAASVIPLVPGPVLVWGIGLIYAILTGFERVTGVAVVIMTVFMLAGATSGWWMQALGMRTSGGSWLAIVGALLGGLVGAFVIPLPILGALVGAVVGAILIEFVRAGRLRVALNVGGAALKGFFLGLVVEFAASLLIFLTFVGALII